MVPTSVYVFGVLNSSALLSFEVFMNPEDENGYNIQVYFPSATTTIVLADFPLYVNTDWLQLSLILGGDGASHQFQVSDLSRNMLFQSVVLTYVHTYSVYVFLQLIHAQSTRNRYTERRRAKLHGLVLFIVKFSFSDKSHSILYDPIRA